MIAVSARLKALSQGANASPPSHLGTRYDTAGRFLPDPGNTIVCHLPPGSATERALLDLRERMMAAPFGRRLAFTAASSLHMTLFQGILARRRQPGFWPEAIPLDAPTERTTEIFLDRLADLPPGPPFRIAATEVTPLGLDVDGLAAVDRRALAIWRDRLADVMGLRHPDHETYRFHITFAYMIDWIPDEDLPAAAAWLGDAFARLSREVPVLELNAPAFCRFEDMNRFEELLMLGTEVPSS